MFVSLFLCFSAAEEYLKLICICKSALCVKDNTICTNQAILDPTLSTFANDFTLARKNLKDIIVYYNNEDDDSMEFDIRLISGLNLNFTSYKGHVDVTILYYNDKDYYGNNFVFDNMINGYFVPQMETAAKTNNLKINSIVAPDSEVKFYRNGELKTGLSYEFIDIKATSLLNISSLKKIKTGETSLHLGKDAKLTVSYKKLDSSLTYMDNVIAYSYIKGDKLNLVGQYVSSEYDDSLIISFEEGISPSDIPLLSISGITTIEFMGRLWAPSKEKPVSDIYKIRNLKLPSGNFPFSIYSNKINLQIEGDTVFHGNFDAFSWIVDSAEMMINTSLEKDVSLDFKGYVDSVILPRSPYLKLNIDHYVFNSTTSYDFPIQFCYNEKSYSSIYIKELEISTQNKTWANRFTGYPTLNEIYSDEQLQEITIFKNGFSFLDIPYNCFTVNNLNIKIDPSSPSASNEIPGFTDKSNCLGLFSDESKRYQIKARIVRTAYTIPVYICISSSYSCGYPPGFNYNPYQSIKDFDGNISKYIRNGYTQIVIGISQSYRNNILNLNFDSMPKKIYNISIYGSGDENSATQVTLIAKNIEIDQLVTQDVKFNGDHHFNMKSAKFTSTYFFPGYKYTIEENIDISTDLTTLKSLFKIDAEIKLNVLSVFQPFGGYNRIDTLNIDLKTFDLCAKEEYGSDSKCVKFSSSSIKKLKYKAESKIIITNNAIAKDFLPLTIEVSLKSYKTFNVVLAGKGWNTTIDNKITIEHDVIPVNIMVSEPNQADNIAFSGKGQVLFSIDYGYEKKICVYKEGWGNSCKYDYGITAIANDDQLVEKLLALTDKSITILVEYVDKPVQLPFSFFDLKKVKLQTFNDYNNPNAKQAFEIVFDKTSINQKYSSTIFDTISLQLSENKAVSTQLGILSIKNGLNVTNEWKMNVNLDVSQFECSYDDLKQFKSVKIDDQLKLSGSFPTEGDLIEVTFEPDQDANDLVADIDSDSKIVIGKNSILVNDKIKFNVKHSENYDAYFNLKKSIKLTIECLDGVTSNEFLKFVVDSGKNNDLSVKFKGNFPTIEPAEESYIRVTGKQSLSLYADKSVPASIDSFSSINIFSTGNDVIISGPVDYNSNLNFNNNFTSPAKLTITKGINIVAKSPEIPLRIYSSDITVVLDAVINPNEQKTRIKLINTIGMNGASKFVFSSKLPEGITLNKECSIISTLYDQIPDESNFPFLSRNETIIEATSDDIALVEFSFSYIKDDSILKRTHGFYETMNCLGIKSEAIDSGKRFSVQLYAMFMPSKIPFIVDIVPIGQKTNGEILIEENKQEVLENIKDLVPSKVIGIYLRLFTNMNSSYPLKLEAIIGNTKELTVSVKSFTDLRSKAFITPPNNKIINISLVNIELMFVTDKKASTNINAHFINFTDVTFVNINEFKIESVDSLALDVECLNALVGSNALTSYKNPLQIHSANVISFTKDGWKFLEQLDGKDIQLIKASEFTKVSFETSRTCFLSINEDVGNSIHGFKLNSYPADDGSVYMELNSGWKRVKELNGFMIDVHEAKKVKLNTASYPIPKIFNIDDSKIIYKFETDETGKFDIITLDDGRIFDNEVFRIDFTYLTEEFRYIRGTNVTFIGSSGFEFTDSLGTAQLVNVSLKENSSTTFSNFESLDHLILEQGAKLSGNIGYSPSSKVVMHWTLLNFPNIVHELFVSGAPMNLVLVYDLDAADKELYRKTMLY